MSRRSSQIFKIPRNLADSNIPRKISRNENLEKLTPQGRNLIANDSNIEKAEKRPQMSTNSEKTSNQRDVDFCEPEGALHMIYWQDCISQMALYIQEKQNTSEKCDFSFMKPAVIQYLFTVCIRLRLPNEVRFTAALILNTYMLRQILSLRTFLDEQSDLNEAQKVKEWETIETNAERQIPLRVLSAIQISSKIHSYHDSLSARQIVNCLRSLSFPYTIDAVKNSELRVYKMIGFKVPESPLTVCEMAMKVLTYTMDKRNWIQRELYETIWQHILVILDVCFIHHTAVYNIFMSMEPEYENQYSSLVVSKFKWDFLLLASAVIQTAVYCVIGKWDVAMVAEVVNRILKCDSYNANLLHKAILNLIQNNLEG